MTCHLGRSIARTLAALIIPSSIALVGLSSAVSTGRGADSGISANTGDLAQDAEAPNAATPTAPAKTTLMQEDRSPQPAFDPVTERITYLHSRLRITPAQEPLWANLVQVMQENANSVALLLKERFQILKGGTAIESISTYEKLGEAQLDGLKKFAAAFQALYSSLSDDQMKIADVIFRLGVLHAVGSPQVPGQLVTPAAPYGYNPSYPAVAAPPVYPYYPPYSDYFASNPLLFNFPIGLGSSFFFHRHHGFFRPPVRVDVPPMRLGVPPLRSGILPVRPGAPPLRLGVSPGRAAVMPFRSR